MLKFVQSPETLCFPNKHRVFFRYVMFIGFCGSWYNYMYYTFKIVLYIYTHAYVFANYHRGPAYVIRLPCVPFHQLNALLDWQDAATAQSCGGESGAKPLFGLGRSRWLPTKTGGAKPGARHLFHHKDMSLIFGGSILFVGCVCVC